MKTIGLISNLQGIKIATLVRNIDHWFKQRGIELLVDDETARLIERPATGCNRYDLVRRVQCLMALGGDGTLLHSARLTAALGVPIFGVNLGHLGFLTEVAIPYLYQALESLLADNYTIEERMMLQAGVCRNSLVYEPVIGLNDAVITKGAFSRIIAFEIMVDGQLFNTYHADGAIISTPTGSTAYSMSAGGPIVLPNLDLLLMTPICPHSLWARPLVIAADSQVQIKLLSGLGEIMLTIDGQHGMHLRTGDLITISKGKFRAKFIKLSNKTFFQILKEKLKEGKGPSI